MEHEIYALAIYTVTIQALKMYGNLYEQRIKSCILAQPNKRVQTFYHYSFEP